MSMTNADLVRKLVLQDLKARGGTLGEAPYKTERFGKHYSVLIGIGKDHTAELTLNEDALQVLLGGDDD